MMNQVHANPCSSLTVKKRICIYLLDIDTRLVRVVAWVDSAISAIPYVYVKRYSSIVAPAYLINRATLLKYWG